MNLFYFILILSSFCLFISFNPVSSVFFHIAEGEEKCFLEDVPADVLISGTILTTIYNKYNVSIYCLYILFTRVYCLYILVFCRYF